MNIAGKEAPERLGYLMLANKLYLRLSCLYVRFFLTHINSPCMESSDRCACKFDKVLGSDRRCDAEDARPHEGRCIPASHLSHHLYNAL